MRLSKKRKVKAIGIILLLFNSAGAIAQELTISAELRPRTEYRNGYSSPVGESSSPGVFTTQRTRLNASFKNSYLKTYFSVQDSRTFGESAITSEVSSSSGALSVYEAWADILLMPGGSVTIGRQALAYDDNRIFTRSNWSNTGKSHDAAVFKYQLESIFTANLGLTYNNDKEISKEATYSGVTKYRYMGYLWLSKNIISGMSISALALDEGIQKQGTDANGNTTYSSKVDMYHRYTVGGNLKFANAESPFSCLATAYFQFGKTTATKDLNASLIALKMNYKINPITTPTIGFDLYSGSDGKNTTKSKTFNWLYGGTHSFNGYMDYWTGSLPTQGLLDVYGQIAGAINAKLSYEAGYHIFKTEKEMQYLSENHGKSLGSELDLKLSYKINKCVSVEGGWGSYFLSDNSRYLKLKSTEAKSHNPGWAYVSLTIRPESFLLKL
ncbi:MAG: alginate export family protein [Bacteroidaceae bacterium]